MGLKFNPLTFSGFSRTGSGSGSGVTSVNGDTGPAVTLDATDVGAANQALSNLTSPTAINQHLLPGADNAIDIGNQTNTLRNVFINGYLVDTNDFGVIHVGGRALAATSGVSVFTWGTGNLTGIGTNQIKNIADPSDAQDVATKAYVDANVGTLPDGAVNAGSDASPTLLTDDFGFYYVGNGNAEAIPSVRIPKGVDYPEGAPITISNSTGTTLRIYTASSADLSAIQLGQYSVATYLEIPNASTVTLYNLHDIINGILPGDVSLWYGSSITGMNVDNGTVDVAANYTIPSTNFAKFYNCAPVGANQTITLPAASGANRGTELVFVQTNADFTTFIVDDAMAPIYDMSLATQYVRLVNITGNAWRVVGETV